MNLTRRDFIELAIVTGAYLATNPVSALAKMSLSDLLAFRETGNVTLLFTTDLHAHLRPHYFSEPINLVVPKNLRGLPGTVTGEEFLRMYKIAPGTLEAYFMSCVDFPKLARKFGKMGGAPHITWLVKKIISERGRDKVLLLDGGDTWVTTAVGTFTDGKAVVDWMKLTGYDVMVGHWEFTLGKEKVLKRIKELQSAGCEFISQNIREVDEFGFEGDLVFKPYAIKEVGGARLGIIGNSFPFTPIANPKQFVEGWSFGIREDTLQEYVNELKEKHKVDAVILLSHDGLLLDIALAKKVSGIDIIISGHTHDVVPKAYKVPGTNTIVVIAGSHGKFLGRLDLDVKNGRIRDLSYKLYPIASNLIPADPEAQKLVDSYWSELDKKLGLSKELCTTEVMLYKRDTFFSTWDWLVGEAINDYYGGELDVVTSPGYRWGTVVLPGEKVTVDHVYAYTAITYPNVYVLRRTGKQLKTVWEDVADNVFNPDPFYQQGGDMSRLWNVEYEIEVNGPPYNRLRNITIGGKPLKPDKEYLVAVYGGPPPPPDTLEPGYKPVPVYEILINYLKKKESVKPRTEPNVKVLDAPYKPYDACYGGGS
ncbi:MAG: thiosulfohydrolase SoxB [Aquificae bacterium]|nr:thiosulfohydrolase SoxB [Aquificota bacterium]